MNKEAEIKTDNEKATPAPSPEAQAPAKVVEAVTPVDSHTEIAKQNAAFAAMRKRAREAEKKLAQASQVSTPPPTPPTEVQAVQEVKQEVATAPVPVRTEVDVEAESEKAVVELGKDAELAKVPGAVVDIITMVDNDPRLARLHSIDPTLAFREAKGLYLSRAGISTPPPVPKVTPPATGVKGGSEDLAVLLNEIDNCRPGTPRFNELKKKIDAIRRKGK